MRKASARRSWRDSGGESATRACQRGSLTFAVWNSGVVDEGSPLWRELFREVLRRILADAQEAGGVRQAAEPSVLCFQQTPEG